MAAPDDDFAAFMAEIEQAAPIEGAALPSASDGAVVGSKREREETTEASSVAAASAPSEPLPLPAVKKTKVVAARAKPQLVQPVAPPPPVQPSESMPPPGPGMGPPPGDMGFGGGSGGNYMGPVGGGMMSGMGGSGGVYDAAFNGLSSQQSAYQYMEHADTQGKKSKKFVRVGAGDMWEDSTLNDWPEGDFRLFCGDLGNEVTDEMLGSAFRKYKSFAKAKVIREKQIMRDGKPRPGGGKTKGYGFVSFTDPFDGLKALREMNGKYIGSRPVKIRKSEWQERNLNEARKKDKNKKKFLSSLGIA